MKASIFVDPLKQQLFDRDGYLVLDNFISTAMAESIKDHFNQLHPILPQGFYSSASNPNDGFKQAIREHTESIFAPIIDSVFKDFKKLGSSYLSKAPGLESKMSVHQDWVVCDESVAYTATIWVPTIDTNDINGALRVLPGSHLFFDDLRGATLPVVFDGFQQLLWDEMVEIPLKVGQAIVINHALIHASAPNLSNQARIAVAYGLTHFNTQLMFYYKNNNGKVEQYLMPDDLFLRYFNVGERPGFGELMAEFDDDIKPVKHAAILQHLIQKAKRQRQMKPLFKNPDTQELFEKEGYVKLVILGEQEVNELLQYYQSLSLKDETGFGFHVSMDSADKNLVSQILNKILEVALPKAMPHFSNAQAYVASFVIKESNPVGLVPVHQDWSFVDDESQHCSVTCWIPLQDVTIDNGALGVIRGSHTFMNNHRPSPSTQALSPLAEHRFAIFPYMQVVELKAGEALVFDHRTFHGSPPNISGVPRVAVGIGFTQQDAKLSHYYLKPGRHDKLLKHAIDSKFFLKYEDKKLAVMYDSGELIEGYTQVDEIDYLLPKYTENELLELVKNSGNEFDKRLGNILAPLFDNAHNVTDRNAETVESANEVDKKLATVGETAWIDDRPFLIKYSPLNIAREIRHRLTGN